MSERGRWLVLVALASCARPAVVRAPGVEPLDATRVRAVLGAHCGECHEGSRPTAKASALAVFDLERARWEQRLTDRQASTLEGRMGALSDAERAEALAWIFASRASAGARSNNAKR